MRQRFYIKNLSLRVWVGGWVGGWFPLSHTALPVTVIMHRGWIKSIPRTSSSCVDDLWTYPSRARFPWQKFSAGHLANQSSLKENEASSSSRLHLVFNSRSNIAAERHIMFITPLVCRDVIMSLGLAMPWHEAHTSHQKGNKSETEYSQTTVMSCVSEWSGRILSGRGSGGIVDERKCSRAEEINTTGGRAE